MAAAAVGPVGSGLGKRPPPCLRAAAGHGAFCRFPGLPPPRGSRGLSEAAVEAGGCRGRLW